MQQHTRFASGLARCKPHACPKRKAHNLADCTADEVMKCFEASVDKSDVFRFITHDCIQTGSRQMPSFRRCGLAIVALIPLVSVGCDSVDETIGSVHNPIYVEARSAIEALEWSARDGFDPQWRDIYRLIESENGAQYYDWEPAWLEHRNPVEEQLNYAKATGQLTWSQVEELTNRLSAADRLVRHRVLDYQRETFAALKEWHQAASEWMQNAEFDISLKYLGIREFRSVEVKSARDKLLANRYIPHQHDPKVYIGLGTDDHYGRKADQLRRKFEWALWKRFADQKGIDTGLLSSYLNEAGQVYSDPYLTFQISYGGRFPNEMYESIHDDVATASRNARLEDMRARQQEQEQARHEKRLMTPPPVLVRGFISSQEDVRAILGVRLGYSTINESVISVGDIIRVSGVEWMVIEIDPGDRTVVLGHSGTQITHVIAMAH